MAGAYDIAVAGGIESMTRTPMGSSVVRDFGFPFGPRMMARYTDDEGHSQLKGQGIGAEMIADQWGISREELDAFSVRSHQRAATATAEGRFENEIVPVVCATTRATTPTRSSPPTRASGRTPASRRWPS